MEAFSPSLSRLGWAMLVSGALTVAASTGGGLLELARQISTPAHTAAITRMPDSSMEGVDLRLGRPQCGHARADDETS